jgi:hypothetical protein
MSSAAETLYQQLCAAGIALPYRENLDAYRETLRDGFAAYIKVAVEAFDGQIEVIKINGIRCRQLTPRGWNEQRDQCILYA